MAKGRALIVWGGWKGHEPEQVADLFREILLNEFFEVQVEDSLEAFEDEKTLANLSLIVPIVTMSPNPAAPGPHIGNPCDMPQVFTKMFGNGRVFYSALGHNRTVLEAAEPRELMRRGFLWAAKNAGL